MSTYSFGALVATATGSVRVDKRLIGQRVRQQRNRLGWSQAELARRAGDKDKGTIWRIEKGRQIPETELVVAFARLFQVSTDYLLGLADVPEPYLAADEQEFLEIYRADPGGIRDLIASAFRLHANRRDGS